MTKPFRFELKKMLVINISDFETVCSSLEKTKKKSISRHFLTFIKYTQSIESKDSRQKIILSENPKQFPYVNDD